MMMHGLTNPKYIETFLKNCHLPYKALLVLYLLRICSRTILEVFLIRLSFVKGAYRRIRCYYIGMFILVDGRKESFLLNRSGVPKLG